MDNTLTLDFLRRSFERTAALAQSFRHVEDSGVMGVLRESLIESFLEPLLMPPYRAGTGVIVDAAGHQTGQCDIIIWDDSIFRPLYSARGAGIYLVESVVATIEIKSTLKRDGIRQAIQRARDLKNMIMFTTPAADGQHRAWTNAPNILPINMIFGFASDMDGSERERAESVAIEENIELWEYLQVLVVHGKDSWIFQPSGATLYSPNAPYLHEVIGPFAGMFNAFRGLSERRGKPILGPYMIPYDVKFPPQNPAAPQSDMTKPK